MVSYVRLWNLLKEKGLRKVDLRKAANLSSSTVAKLNRGENVNTAVLIKICEALNCDFVDIMSYIPDDECHNEEQH